jgi:tetratricopeptide (TPR) repeat protein
VTSTDEPVIMCAMTEDLYERYKEALRSGHVAVLRGALEEAIRMYTSAAEIAPSRALPHTSLGGVYMRLSRLDEALTEYAAAVARSPHDEGALLGQADALATAGRPKDAAIALDHVAEIQEASARLPEAADTLRRALELAEAPERVHRQRALLREIRLSAGDRAAEQLLARALRLRDEPDDTVVLRSPAPLATATATAHAVPDAEPVTAEGEPAVELESVVDVSTAAEPAVEPAIAPRSDFEPAGEFDLEPAAESVIGLEASAYSGPAAEYEEPVQVVAESVEVVAQSGAQEAEPETEFNPEPVGSAIDEQVGPALGSSAGAATVELEEPPAVGVMAGVDEPVSAASSEPAQPQPTGDELLAAAEAAEEAGDDPSLRSLLLWTARAYAREGRFEAGLDAAHRLLLRSPSDVDAHLVLVELYVARSWDALAAEKLLLLGRLADLDGDEATRLRICQAASRAFPGNQRLEALCS